jgi:hypothetical protein
VPPTIFLEDRDEVSRVPPWNIKEESYAVFWVKPSTLFDDRDDVFWVPTYKIREDWDAVSGCQLRKFSSFLGATLGFS